MGVDWDAIIVVIFDSLSLSNAPWNAWELEFIENLKDTKWNDLSLKQQGIVQKMWDKL